MPMDRSLYPPNWDTIALQVKTAANWTCQSCGRQCRRSNESKHDFASKLTNAWENECQVLFEFLEHPQRWTLTVAHMNHIPSDCRPENLRALCSGCHLRYDGKQMTLKKRLKRERNGQLRIAGT